MRKYSLILITLFVVFVAKAVDYKILSTNADQITFTCYVVEYTSVDADGVTPIQLSGIVTIPNVLLLAETDVLVVDSHHTICDDKSAPSMQGGTASCIGAGGLGLGALYPMAATDYVGYGITRDKQHPYLCQEQNARNSLDLIPVALDILAQNGIVPKMLYNVGYSQGGSVALAAQKLLETDAQYADLKKLFPLGMHAACGDGPYDPITTAKDIYGKAEKVTLPAVLPLLVNGFLCGAPKDLSEGIKFADFFQSALNTPATLSNPTTGESIEFPGLEAIVNAKKFTNEEVSAAMVLACGGKQGLADFFSEDMMNPESELYKRFFSWLECNSVCTGWKPEGEVLFSHLVEDDVVTVENTHLAVKELEIPEDRVKLYNASDLDITGDEKHSKFAPTFFIGLLSTIDNSLNSLDTIETASDATIPSYDLYGHQVREIKGLGIKNGQKVFIK